MLCSSLWYYDKPAGNIKSLFSPRAPMHRLIEFYLGISKLVISRERILTHWNGP